MVKKKRENVSFFSLLLIFVNKKKEKQTDFVKLWREMMCVSFFILNFTS